MKTYTAIIRDETVAHMTAKFLVIRSQWFEFTPLPDGEYEFRVKIENQAYMEKLVTTLQGFTGKGKVA